jgi:alpha-L-fucosidase
MRKLCCWLTLIFLNPFSLIADSEFRSQWFQDARFGMFIHWGLYSELAGSWSGRTLPDPSLPNGDNWYSEWIQARLEVPGEEYRKLVDVFNPTEFDAEAWAQEAELAGMKYLVITSKHHDGFALWDSDVSDYDLGATPYEGDLLGDLVEACRKRDIKVGFYYSHWQDWEHPGGAVPAWPGTPPYPSQEDFDRYWNEKCLPQVAELLDRYDPDLLWFDTWYVNAGKLISPAKRDELIDLIRSKSERCLINGRILAHDPGPRVDYLSAGDNEFPEHNMGRPWQTPATMRKSWAWHASDFNWKPSETITRLLVQNASLGGNLLLNIGPYANGEIPSPAIRRLREIGGWLHAHGESIYGAHPLDDVPVPEWGRLTRRKTADGTEIVYAHVMDWPEGRPVHLPSELGPAQSATVLETGESVILSEDGLSFVKPDGGLHPAVATIRMIME